MSHDNATSPLPRTRAKRQPRAGWRAHLPIAALALLFGGPAFAASFLCDKAQSSVEQMICADAELSAMDEKLAATYRQALAAAVEPEALRRAQREWLTKTRNACGDAKCIQNAYSVRLEELSAIAFANSASNATGLTPSNGFVSKRDQGVRVIETEVDTLGEAIA